MGSFSLLLAILGLHLLFLSLLSPPFYDFSWILYLLHLKNQAFQSRGSSILKFSHSSLKCRFRTLLGPFWGPLGGMLGPLGGLLAAIWGLLGASWRCLGNAFRDSWGLLGRQSAQEAPKIPLRAPRRPPEAPRKAPRDPPRTGFETRPELQQFRYE